MGDFKLLFRLNFEGGGIIFSCILFLNFGGGGRVGDLFVIELLIVILCIGILELGFDFLFIIGFFFLKFAMRFFMFLFFNSKSDFFVVFIGVILFFFVDFVG